MLTLALRLFTDCFGMVRDASIAKQLQIWKIVKQTCKLMCHDSEAKIEFHFRKLVYSEDLER